MEKKTLQILSGMHTIEIYTRKKIVKVILLNFRSRLGHMDKLEII